MAADVAPTADVDELQPVDLIILGSVAVDRSGARIGKGAGYSDLEYALLAEAGLVGPHTVIATTVHSLQVVDSVPTTSHDVSIDLIVTPNEVIHCPAKHRPVGILWDDISPDKVRAIPVLAKRQAAQARHA